MDLCYPIPHLLPLQAHENTLLIKRSRFLTHIIHAASTGEAKAFIETMRTQYADASHNCWAFVAGPPGSTAQIGASDDGEPHGTAGRPMLQILLHSGVGEICAVVTRWFGGIKLGTGGLVRAYQDSVSQCLTTLPTREKVPEQDFLIECNYADVNRVRRFLAQLPAQIKEEVWTEGLQLTVAIPKAKKELFESGLAQVTDGRAESLLIEP